MAFAEAGVSDRIETSPKLTSHVAGLKISLAGMF
jgi:hypothetical protein